MARLFCQIEHVVRNRSLFGGDLVQIRALAVSSGCFFVRRCGKPQSADLTRREMSTHVAVGVDWVSGSDGNSKGGQVGEQERRAEVWRTSSATRICRSFADTRRTRSERSTVCGGTSWACPRTTKTRLGLAWAGGAPAPGQRCEGSGGLRTLASKRLNSVFQVGLST